MSQTLSGISMAPLPASQDGQFQAPSGLVHYEFRLQAQLRQHSYP